MARSAIYPIIFGTMLIALGMMPRLITALMEELEDFRTLFTQLPRRATDIPGSADLWLVAGGGVMVIAGLVSTLVR